MSSRSFARRFLMVLVALAVAGAFELTPGHARAVAARQGAAVAMSPGLPRAGLPTTPGVPDTGGHQGSGIALPRVAHRLSQGALKIVAFGSSSTKGTGASSPASAYPARLQDDLSQLLPHVSVAVINQGIGGEDALDMERRLPNVLASRPDLVIFQTGTNDPLRGVPIDRFLALTREVVSRLRLADIDVMLMEPQLCRVTQATPSSILYRDAVRAIALEMRVPVIRRWDLMQGWLKHDQVTAVQMLAPDGLHMADAGYALLAREVATEILAGTQ